MANKDRRFSTAMLLDGKGGARELSDEEVDGWNRDDGILWLDVNHNDKRGREWLAKHGKLDPQVSGILLAGETRPRSLAGANTLVVIMRGINMNPGAVPDDMVAVRMAIEKSRIITSRRRKVLSIGDLKRSLLQGDGPKTAGGFLVSVIESIASRIESAVENIEDMIDELDEKMADGSVNSIRGTLSIVRRQAAAIRRHLAPQRDALDRITRGHAGILSDSEVFDLREAGDHLTRQIEDLDLARENALVTQEELMNRVALEQNERMYLLSIVAAVFLPLTFITGMLGMNVAGLPGTTNPNGFIYSSIVMVVSFLALLVYFRWRKWL